MTLDDLFPLGFTLSDIDRLAEALERDQMSLDNLAIAFGKSTAALYTAATLVAREMLCGELDLIAPNFAESAEDFLAARAERIHNERERRRILKSLSAIEADLALYALERAQAA